MNLENAMRMYAVFALYGGPDQLMPITSGLTAIFVFILIFWNKVLVMARKFLGLFRASPESTRRQENDSLDTPSNRVEDPSDLAKRGR